MSMNKMLYFQKIKQKLMSYLSRCQNARQIKQIQQKLSVIFKSNRWTRKKGQISRVGRVSCSALWSGFGFFDFARVGFWVFEYFLGSPSGQARVKIVCIFQSILAGSCKNLAIFHKKKFTSGYSVFAKFTTVCSGRVLGF